MKGGSVPSKFQSHLLYKKICIVLAQMYKINNLPMSYKPSSSKEAKGPHLVLSQLFEGGMEFKLLFGTLFVADDKELVNFSL